MRRIFKQWKSIQVSIHPQTIGTVRNVRQLNMRNFSASHIKHCTTTGTQARAEMNNKDNTLYGGTNLWLHNMTGKICSVYLFSASYNPMQGVHISTLLTTYKYEYGINWILVLK